jgi:hypothetical protein
LVLSIGVFGGKKLMHLIKLSMETLGQRISRLPLEIVGWVDCVSMAVVRHMLIGAVAPRFSFCDGFCKKAREMARKKSKSKRRTREEREKEKETSEKKRKRRARKKAREERVLSRA